MAGLRKSRGLKTAACAPLKSSQEPHFAAVFSGAMLTGREKEGGKDVS